MNFTGYIKYDEIEYTFTYKDKLLTLIVSNQDSCKNFYFYQLGKVEYFKGYTSQGREIYFFIDKEIIRVNGVIKCYPKMVIHSKESNYNLSETKYNALKLSGGVINNFYSNRHILNLENPFTTRDIKFKELDQAKKEETIIIDNKKAIFQISVSYPSVSYSTRIDIGNIDSVIRIIYNKPWKAEDLINSILKINDLLYFCMNRRYFGFNEMCLQLKNEDGKFFNAAEIYIPYDNDVEAPENLIYYELIEGKINKILKILDNVNYLTYSIPVDKKEFYFTTATNYTKIFSTFQSLYNYCHSKKKIVYEDSKFEELKNEIINSLNSLSEKYKGIDGEKRKYIGRYINIVKTSNLKLENMIIQEVKKYIDVLRNLPDKKYIIIMENYTEAIKDAVNDRDLITHSDVFAPSDSDIAVYLVIKRLIYSMVLRKIGLTKSEVKKIICFLNRRSVI